MPSVITHKQRERLLKRPSDGSDEKTLRDRRLNDFYVKKALKRWVDSIEDVNIALGILPEKQTRGLFEDEDIFQLLEIVERALVYLNFVPLRRGGDGELHAEKSMAAHPETGRPKNYIESRPANDQDKKRFGALKRYLARFAKFERPGPWAVYEDLDRIYYKDLIKKAEKEGYEPVDAGETPDHLWLPQLTDAQRKFREEQRLLMGLGFDIETLAELEELKQKKKPK
jgi:hypothetical protein